MWVSNDFLKELMFVTPHAIERFAERGGEGEIRSAISKSLPFGIQKADALLLLDNDTVFVTKKPGLRRVVVTCLTKSYAVANMQTLGFKFTMPPANQVQPTPSDNGVSRGAACQQADSLIDQMSLVPSRSDEQLSEMLGAISKTRDSLSGKRSAGRVTDLGLLLQLIQHEQAMRRKVTGAAAHGIRQDRELAGLKRAMKEMIDYDTCKRIGERASVIRDIMGDDICKPGWHTVLDEREGRPGLTKSLQSAQ